MTQQILVVNDDLEMVRLLRAHLEISDYEVLVAGDGEAALHILRRERPDLVLLNLGLPEGDGWDVARAGRSDAGLIAMPVVGLDLSVDDYATRSLNLSEVVAQVEAVLRQVQAEPAPARSIQVAELRIDLAAHRVAVRGQPVHLTPTEFGLLRALAEQPGHALTRQEMSENGLGYSYEGLERTVDSHVKNLRQKLDEAGDAAHLIETVFGVGYRLDTNDHT